MRIASLIFLISIHSTTYAGFSVAPTPTDWSRTSSETVEEPFSVVAELVSKDIHENLSQEAARLTHSCLEIVDRKLSQLSTHWADPIAGFASTLSSIRYTLPALKSSAIYNPDEMGLDFAIGINGVEVGGLASATGSPTTSDMIAGHLAQQLEPPADESQTEQPIQEDSEATIAQQLAYLLFLGTAFLSSLRHRQQQLRRRELLRRRLLKQARLEAKKQRELELAQQASTF